MQSSPPYDSPAGAGDVFSNAPGTFPNVTAAGFARLSTAPERSLQAFLRDSRPARHAPSQRRHRTGISPEQVRLLAIAGGVVVVVIAALLVLPGLIPPAGTQNSTASTPGSPLIQVPGVGCSDGRSSCNGKCVDLKTDSENCGGCGFSVPYGESCINGQFSSVVNKVNRTSAAGPATTGTAAAAGTTAGTCPTGRWSCGGACVDPGSDHNNCGACGTVCPSIEVCQNGQCVLPATTAVATTIATVTADLSCSRDEIACNGSCVNVFSDRKNCGVCGRACKADETCLNARCGPACMNNGTSLCGDSCVDLKSDADNCGSCGTECKSFLPNAKGSECADGTCAITQCSSGYANCDKNVANGCEVNTRTDASNCGSCGTKCASGKVCYNGVCSTPATT